jgi:hypothetical protein
LALYFFVCVHSEVQNHRCKDDSKMLELNKILSKLRKSTERNDYWQICNWTFGQFFIACVTWQNPKIQFKSKHMNSMKGILKQGLIIFFFHLVSFIFLIKRWNPMIPGNVSDNENVLFQFLLDAQCVMKTQLCKKF